MNNNSMKKEITYDRSRLKKIDLKKIFKLKLSYMFNKTSILLFAIVSVLLICALLLEAFSISDASYEEIIERYKLNSFMYIKILMTIFSIFLFMMTSSFRNEFLSLILIPLGLSKRKNFIINVMILFIMYLILFIAFAYVGVHLHNFYVMEEYIRAFVNMFLMSIIYGLITLLLMQIVKNSLVMLVSIFLLIISNSIIGEMVDGGFAPIFLLVIPNVNDKGMFITSSLYLGFLFLFYLVLNMTVYCDKDMV